LISICSGLLVGAGLLALAVAAGGGASECAVTVLGAAVLAKAGRRLDGVRTALAGATAALALIGGAGSALGGVSGTLGTDCAIGASLGA